MIFGFVVGVRKGKLEKIKPPPPQYLLNVIYKIIFNYHIQDIFLKIITIGIYIKLIFWSLYNLYIFF